jgi:hypothetical protein
VRGFIRRDRMKKMTKFKVGDKVVPIKSTFGVTGKVGTIEKRGDMYDWLVFFGNKAREPFDEKDLVHFEEEETMTKEKKFFRGQPLITTDGDEVTYLYDDGGNCWPVRVLDEDAVDCLDYAELEPSKHFTFSQVVAGLEQEYFEVGTSFQVDGKSLYVDCTPISGYGLKEDEDGVCVSAHIGANLINSTWKLVKPEQPIKEITIDEIESLLGYKVKIKNND